ncbi:MAG: hypothetical protein EA401_01815 [Planctomycetota bacterium]|nr:MAG: hypothetical protein EA401_01815 [Planctomycetota bacterium]
MNKKARASWMVNPHVIMLAAVALGLLLAAVWFITMNLVVPAKDQAMSPQETAPTYLCFGDSITDNGGWIESLNAQGGAQFINVGKSGRKAQNMASEFPPVLSAHPQADHLLLFIGINDLPSRDPRPGSERIQAAMQGVRSAVDLALERMPPANIHLLTPCGVVPDAMSELNVRKGYADALPLLPEYSQALRDLAAERGLQVIDLLGHLDATHFRDGLHPNADGEARIAELVHAHLYPLARLYWVGDSISINYHRPLQAVLADRFRYMRKGGLTQAEADLDQAQGANGGDSQRVLAHLRELIAHDRLSADTVVVNCGLHDIKKDPQEQTLQVDLETYRENLKTMVQLVEGSGRRFIWVTTTPVDEVQHQKNNPSFHRLEADLAAYNSAALEIMKAHDITIIDLYNFTRSLGPDLYRDHVHFHPWVSEQQALFLAERLREVFMS